MSPSLGLQKRQQQLYFWLQLAGPWILCDWGLGGVCEPGLVNACVQGTPRPWTPCTWIVRSNLASNHETYQERRAVPRAAQVFGGSAGLVDMLVEHIPSSKKATVKKVQRDFTGEAVMGGCGRALKSSGCSATSRVRQWWGAVGVR